MSRNKALRIIVDLEIQAVTCPGVWLCPNGNVQLLFSMLGQEVQTKSLPPVFPLLFHEKLTFQKTFTSAGCLAEVQNALGQEDVYAVLLQETDNIGHGAAVQLARFHSTALHILYPSPCSKGLLAGVDVDLLMEPSADYPGILSPKIELSTNTIIEEVTNIKPEGFVINPKTLCSQKKSIIRGSAPHDVTQLVHSDGRYQRRLSNQGHNSKCHLPGMPTTGNIRLPCSQPPTIPKDPKQCSHIRCPHGAFDFREMCHCEAGHVSSLCPLCSRYKAIFSSMSDFPEELDETKNQQFDMPLKHISAGRCHLENTKRLSSALHAHVDHVLEPGLNSLLNIRDEPVVDSTRHIDQRMPHVFLSGAGRHHKEDAKSKTFTRTDNQSCSQKAFSFEPQSGVSCGDGADFNSSRQLFYANLEKFYRKLYARAKSRAQEESLIGLSAS